MTRRGLFSLVAAAVVLGGCISRPLTPEAVAKRVKHGSLVSDRSRICMLQDTFQAQSVLPIPYQGKMYYG